MTSVTAACPPPATATGATSTTSGQATDGDAFADLVAGMNPRRAADGSPTDERPPAPTDEAAEMPPARGDEVEPRPSTGGKIDPAPKPSRRSVDTKAGLAEATEPTSASPQEAPAAPVRDALRLMTPTSERKSTRDARSSDDERPDRDTAEATATVAPIGAAALALGRLLTEHRLVAAEGGRAGTSARAATVGAAGPRADGSAAGSVAADGAADGGPDPFAGLDAATVAAALPEPSAPEVGSTAAPPRLDVEVLDRATWLPPVVTQDNLRQIADAVVTAAADAAPATSGPAKPVATALASDLQTGLQSHGVVRTLTIRLQPDDLGSLTASFRMVGDTMTLHLTASRPETARQLIADKDRLTGVLEQAGVSARHLVVTVADPAATQSSGSGAGSQGQSGGQPGGQSSGQSGGQPSGQTFSQGEGRSSGGERRPEPQPSQRAAAGGRDDPASPVEARSPLGRAGSRRGDLFL